MEDFSVSSTQCLEQRYDVNLLINTNESKKQNSNSDRGSEAHVCNSALSPDGVFVYCIIKIGARSGSATMVTELSHNSFACESVFPSDGGGEL